MELLEQTNKPSKKQTIYIVVGICAALLLILGIAIYVYFNRQSQKPVSIVQSKKDGSGLPPYEDLEAIARKRGVVPTSRAPDDDAITEHTQSISKIDHQYLDQHFDNFPIADLDRSFTQQIQQIPLATSSQPAIFMIAPTKEHPEMKNSTQSESNNSNLDRQIPSAAINTKEFGKGIPGRKDSLMKPRSDWNPSSRISQDTREDIVPGFQPSNKSPLVITLAECPPGTEEAKVIHPYNACMSDELSLVPNHVIYMIDSFDDGWAAGIDPVTGNQGMFPLSCVQLQIPEVDFTIGGRLSKMVFQEISKSGE